MAEITFPVVMMDPSSRFKENAKWAVFWLVTQLLKWENVSLAIFQVLSTSGEIPNDMRVMLLNQLIITRSRYIKHSI